MVYSCTSDADFVAKTNDKAIIYAIDFFAEWCGPCKVIGPFFSDLSKRYPSLEYLKVDIEKCEQTAMKFGVRAVPTFAFIKAGQTLATIKGGNKEQLEAKVKELANQAGAKLIEGVPEGMVDITASIDKSRSECLNEDDDFTWQNIIDENIQGELKSDCDEQLLLRTEFNQPVKIHSILISPGADAEQAPKTLRLFANETNPLSFDDAETRPATQEFELEFSELTKPIVLRFVKFQNVNNLTLFFKDNQGDNEVTSISKLQLIGMPMSATNMADFKRVAGEAGEAH